MATDDPPATAPTLADQVSRLYDLIAGYHATQLIEIARELGVWEALTSSPAYVRRASNRDRHRPLLHRCAVPDRVLLRPARAPGCRVAHGATL